MIDNNIRIGGYYQHYKGRIYKVFGFATLTGIEEELVFYESVPHPEDTNIWAIPVSMWNELVNGVPRFRYIGENYQNLNLTRR